MTEYEYDGDRIVRSVTTSEPRWTEQDRAEMLALAVFRDRPCRCGCGQPSSLTLIPEDEGPGWVVEQVTCTARMALLEAQRAANKKRGTDNVPARLWSVRPRKTG